MSEIIGEIIKVVFYKVSVIALFILCVATAVMLVSITDISFNERGTEYLMTWGVVSCVCIILIIPHLVESYDPVKKKDNS
jgi:hypothetical protein